MNNISGMRSESDQVYFYERRRKSQQQRRRNDDDCWELHGCHNSSSSRNSSHHNEMASSSPSKPTGDNGRITSGDHTNHAAAGEHRRSNIHHSNGGDSRADHDHKDKVAGGIEDLLAPIHTACARFADDTAFIQAIINENPVSACLPVQIPSKELQQRLRRKRPQIVPFYDAFLPSSDPRHQEWRRKKQQQYNKHADRLGQEQRKDNEDLPQIQQITGDYFIEFGQYPIHIAVSNHGSVDAIKHIINAAPNALAKQDLNGMLPLSLAIRFYRNSIRVQKNTQQNINSKEEVLNLLLSHYPLGAFSVDANKNTPLHYACMVLPYPNTWSPRKMKMRSHEDDFTDDGFPTEKDDCRAKSPPNDMMRKASTHISPKFVKMLAILNPKAIRQQNLHGVTPLEIARRSDLLFSDELCHFLSELSTKDVGYEIKQETT